jgi:hypothetical protein
MSNQYYTICVMPMDGIQHCSGWKLTMGRKILMELIGNQQDGEII